MNFLHVKGTKNEGNEGETLKKEATKSEKNPQKGTV